MTYRNCPLLTVNGITDLATGTNSLGWCLNCRTTSLGQALIHLDKLARLLGLCLNLNDLAKMYDTKESWHGELVRTTDQTTTVIFYFIDRNIYF